MGIAFAAKAIATAFRKPYMLAFAALAAAAFGVVAYAFPIFKIISAVSLFEGADIGLSVIYVLKVIMRHALSAETLTYAAVGMAGLSLVGGLYLSFALGGAFAACEPERLGFRRYLSSSVRSIPHMLLATFVSVLVACAFAVAAVIASVPAIVVTRAVLVGGLAIFNEMVFLDFVTVVTILICYCFIRVYLTFWLVSVFYYGQSFRSGKKLAETAFWSTMLRLLSLDAAFVAMQAAMSPINGQAAGIAVIWAVNTAYLAFGTAYTFIVYGKVRDAYVKGPHGGSAPIRQA